MTDESHRSPPIVRGGTWGGGRPRSEGTGNCPNLILLRRAIRHGTVQDWPRIGVIRWSAFVADGRRQPLPVDRQACVRRWLRCGVGSPWSRYCEIFWQQKHRIGLRTGQPIVDWWLRSRYAGRRL